MSSTLDASDVVANVEKRIRAANGKLTVSSSKSDDDWLYIVVVPSEPGVRALDYAELMSKIERDLRSEGIDNVLLVPALDD